MPILRNYTGSLDNNVINQNVNENGIGINYPCIGDEKRPFVTNYSTIEVARSNIKLLFDTQKGERLMNPDFGIDLIKFCFEPINDATELAIRKDITENIEKYVPIVFIIKLDINISNVNIDRNIISINITFGLKNQPNISSNVNLEI